MAHGQLANFGCVETGPPRPRRPFWHPPPPLVAGEGLPGRLETGPRGSGAGSGPRVVKIYLWYEPWGCGPSRIPPPSSKIYIWSSGRPRRSSDDEGPWCPPMPRPTGSPMTTTRAGRQGWRGPGRGWAAPAPPPTGEFWVCRKISRCRKWGPPNWPDLGVSKMAHRELASLGVSKTAPATPQGLGLGLPAPALPPTGQFSGVRRVPRRRLASLAAAPRG